ncbi:MAG: response regulator [Bacteroidia bacterium]|nr:response regulator [Bacteroidia bacterium]
MAKKVLVVEDYQEYRVVIQHVLTPKGFEVFEAKDGEAGLRAAKEHKPDVIILDLGLPKMSGVEVLQELMKDPELAKIHVIVATANDDEESIRTVTRLGVTNYLTKPYTPGEIMEAVRIIAPKA